jgi:DNA polymerase-3 subunit delta'
LLKTLEEPNGVVRLVLATEATDQLLPTIRSRCQTHTMVWPNEDEALAWLREQVNLDGKLRASLEQARVWLQAAGGRPDDALEWARSGIDAQAWLELPQALARGDWSLVAPWPAARQLALLQKLCHDLMAQASGAAPRYFPASHLPPAPPWRALAQWSKDLLDAARSVEHPFNSGLMQEAWAARTQQMLTRQPVKPAK